MFSALVLYASPASISNIVSAVAAYAVSSSARSRSPLVPLSLEGYGFAPRGEGAEFTNEGSLEWPDGRLPTNTSGGGMSEAYVHGFNLILEGVRQMRGSSTCQVEGAESCLVTSGEGVPTSALVLRR